MAKTKDEKAKENQLIEVGEILFLEILKKASVVLTDTERAELEEMMTAKASPDEIIGFLSIHVPDFEKLVEYETKELQKEYKELFENE